jgi:cell division transport system permease protein
MFSVYILIDHVAKEYKKSIINDYSIIVVSNTPMVKIDKLAGINIKSIEPISRQKIIKEVKNNLSNTSVTLLNNRLPYFYKIYLTEFPTSFMLDTIRKELSKITSIKKIETFSHDHNKIYSMITLIQEIVFILFIVVLVLSALLLSKQIKIWFYEHQERITIIQLHGGTLLYSSIPILKTIITSALISSIVVYAILYTVAVNLSSLVSPELVAIIPTHINISFEIIKLVALAFFIPLVTLIGLLVSYKLK